jgi:arylsulfatase A-like enzyme
MEPIDSLAHTSCTRAAAPWTVIALIVACSMAVGCFERGGSARSDPGPLRLVEALEHASIEVPETIWAPRDLAAGDPVLRDDFDQLGDAWWSEAWLGAGVPDHPANRHLGLHVTVTPEDEASVVSVTPESIAMHRDVRMPGAVYLVRARVRVLRSPSVDGRLPRPSLRARALARMRREIPTRREARGQRFLRGEAAAPVDPALGSDWQVVGLIVRGPMTQQGLRVSLDPDGATLWCDWLTVARLSSSLIRTAATHAESLDPSSIRTRVSIGPDLVDALVLPGGSRVVFALEVPRTGARIDVELARIGSEGSPGLDVAVEIDGRRVARRTVTETHRLDAWRVPLEEYSGRSVELAFVVEGPSESDAILGNPRVLGSRRPSPALNVVLISLDTLRADHLGVYGGPPSSSPHIDQLARDGIRFQNALAPAAWTLPSHVSLMTGQHPLVHQVSRDDRRIDAVRSSVLAERFREAGYLTAAFTGGGFLDPSFGFDLGFDSYSVADAITGDMRAVLDWLDRSRDQPFFLFVHSYFVHNYAPTRPFLEPLAGERTDELLEVDSREVRAKPTAEAVADLNLLYRATVTEADGRIVGRLLSKLESLDLEDETLVVLVSDHGEEFFEHGGTSHSRTVWGEIARVPWIMRGPSVPKGMVVEQAVGLIDVAPTIAAIAGLRDDERVGGRRALPLALPMTPPMAPPMEGTRLDERRYLLNAPSFDALVWQQWKLVRSTRHPGRPSLFRFREDPLDLRDVAADHPDELRTMTLHLTHLLESSARQAEAAPASPAERAEIGEELRARLRELGYLGD